jgi:hypothetical protein
MENAIPKKEINEPDISSGFSHPPKKSYLMHPRQESPSLHNLHLSPKAPVALQVRVFVHHPHPAWVVQSVHVLKSEKINKHNLSW